MTNKVRIKRRDSDVRPSKRSYLGWLDQYSEITNRLLVAPDAFAKRNEAIASIVKSLGCLLRADWVILMVDDGPSHAFHTSWDQASIISPSGKTGSWSARQAEDRQLLPITELPDVSCIVSLFPEQNAARCNWSCFPFATFKTNCALLLAHDPKRTFYSRIEKWIVKDLIEKLKCFFAADLNSDQIPKLLEERINYETIVENTPDPVVITLTNGRISYMNAGAKELFGELIGKNVAEYYFSDETSTGKEKANQVRRMLLDSKDGRILNLETVFTSKEGKAIPVSISANLLRDYRGQIVGMTGIAKDLRKIRSQSIIQDTIARTLDLDQILESALKAVVDILGFDYATISKVDPTLGTIGTTHGKNVSREFLNKAWHSLDSADIQACVVRSRKPVVLDGWDVRLDRTIYDTYHHEELVRIYIPIISRGEAYGTLETGYNKANRTIITDDEQAILFKIVNLVGLGIDQSYLHSKQQKLVDQLQALNESSIFIQRAASVDEVVRGIFESLAHLGYREGMVSLIYEKSERIEGYFAVGEKWEKIKQETKRKLDSQDILAIAIRERKSILSPNCQEDPRCEAVAIRKSKIRSQLVIPIIGPQGPLGALQIDFSEKQGLITGPSDILERHIRLLETFTSQIAVAMVRTKDQSMIDLLQTTLMETAHEFRSPLHNIIAQIGGLKRFFPADLSRDHEVETIFKIISEEAHRARRQMENTLLFSTKTRELIGYHFELGQIQDLIRICAQNFRLRALERTISIIIKDSVNKLPSFAFDRQKIEQVMNNLIDNAIKYSHNGRFVQIHGFDDGANINIEIWDKGLGIPESDYDHIFEGLTRGQVRDKKRYIPGTGLGLKIAKEIALAHGGSIKVKSTPFFNDIEKIKAYDGYDTIFTVILPKKLQEK